MVFRTCGKEIPFLKTSFARTERKLIFRNDLPCPREVISKVEIGFRKHGRRLLMALPSSGLLVSNPHDCVAKDGEIYRISRLSVCLTTHKQRDFPDSKTTIPCGLKIAPEGAGYFVVEVRKKDNQRAQRL